MLYEKEQSLLKEFEDLKKRARENGTPIVFSPDSQELVLYYNEEYNKILVDKSFNRPQGSTTHHLKVVGL